ncbi:hypothetical protein V3Q90_06240 [Flavobacterium oreochromis]
MKWSIEAMLDSCVNLGHCVHGGFRHGLKNPKLCLEIDFQLQQDVN